MYLKNTASQKLEVFVFDYTTGAPKTGDAANLLAYVNIDEGGYATLGDTSATEVDSTNKKGLYLFDLAQAETNGTKLGFFAKSSTANVSCICRPAVSFTQPTAGLASPTNITAATGITVSTNSDKTGYSVTGLTASDVGAIKTKTDFLPSATAGAAGGLFIAGTNAATTITTALTTTFTGNLTGSVASVTGAVGSVTGAVASVTGNVGGNVTGSVGSVVGAVASVTGNVGGNVTGSVGSVVGAVGSVTGAVGSVTGSVGSVTGAVGSVTGAVGSVTGNVGGNVVGSVASVTGLTTATIATAVLTTQMTESYAADGAAPTLAQNSFLVQQALTEFSISSTTMTIKKIDGSATAATCTLNDATTPTAITRAT